MVECVRSVAILCIPADNSVDNAPFAVRELTAGLTNGTYLASLGEGGVHGQTKFGFQAAVSAALVN